MAKVVKYKGMDIPVPEKVPQKILGTVLIIGLAIWGGTKLFGKKPKLPTRNKPYKDPLLIDPKTGEPGLLSAWSPTPLAKELYTSMEGYNMTGRVGPLTKLYGIVDPLKVKAVYYEYNAISNKNDDPMNLTQRIRDEYIANPIKDKLLIKLDTLGLG